jgi:Glycosyltransferase family 87
MESASTPGDWRIAWGYRLGLVGSFALLAAQVFIRQTGDWETVYLGAAKNLRAGTDLLIGGGGTGTGYVYPPFGALFAVPFTFLPRTAGLIAWVIVNLLAVGVLLVGAWRLSGGRGFPGQAGTERFDHIAYWLGGMCVVGFILDAAANWQTDLLIGAMLMGGCVLLARGRGLAAGVTFGIAAAFKCTPLLFAPYLLWKRRFLGAIAVPVVAVGLNLLPDLAYPPQDGKSLLLVWKERFLDPMANKDRDAGLWASAVSYNHSLAGVNLRWFGFERAVIDGWTTATPKASRISADELKRVNFAITGLLGFIALIALWRRPADILPGPVLAAEFGIVFTLMLMLSPMSSKPHFAILLLPQLALARVGWEQRDRLLLGLAVLTAIGGLCTGKDIIGRTAYEFLLWNGMVFWMTTALFLGCCHARYWYGPRKVKATIAEPVPAFRRAA